MLPDPLKFSVNSLDANLQDWRVIDIAPRASQRNIVSNTLSPTGSGEARLIIRHTDTNENAPLGSIRTLIRADADLQGSTRPTEGGTASVQLVIVRPKMAEILPVTMGYMVKGFVAALLASGTEATYDTIKAALDSTYLERVLANEP